MKKYVGAKMPGSKKGTAAATSVDTPALKECLDEIKALKHPLPNICVQADIELCAQAHLDKDSFEDWVALLGELNSLEANKFVGFTVDEFQEDMK